MPPAVTTSTPALTSGVAGHRRCRTDRIDQSPVGNAAGSLAASSGCRATIPIRQEFAEPAMRPPGDDEARDHVEVGARIDVVLDAGRDDRQDGGGALAADVEPGEQPVLAADDQAAQLALAPVVGGVEVAVGEEQQEPLPLAMEIPEGATERRLGRDDCAPVIDPGAQVVEDGFGLALTALTALVGGVPSELEGALDGEQGDDLVQPPERDPHKLHHWESGQKFCNTLAIEKPE